jgi:ABC-type multidrug transport system fused ATPase/permease subunit
MSHKKEASNSSSKSNPPSRSPRVGPRQSSEYSKEGPKRSSKIEEEIPVDEEEKKSARGQLYRVVFCRAFTLFAIIPSVIDGCQPVIMYFLLGDIINYLAGWVIMTNYSQIEAPSPMPDILPYIYGFLALTVGGGIFKFFESFCWVRIGSDLSVKIRKDLFLNMMKSEVAFFDITPIGGVLTLLSEDAQTVQDAFGTIKGSQIQCLAQFLSGMVMSFIYSWKLALVSMCSLPAIFIVLIIFSPHVVKNAKLKFKYVADSMTIAEETLASVRTVRGFNREEQELERFGEATRKASNHETCLGYLIVGMITLVMIMIWGVVLGVLYYGATIVDKGNLESGDLFSVFGFCMMGCFGILMVQGTMQGEQKAISAGARLLKLSTHISNIPFEGGRTIQNFKGHIEFRNVSFKYPTRDICF